jgi:hypothetical protein
MKSTDIDQVLLVGGSSRIPKVTHTHTHTATHTHRYTHMYTYARTEAHAHTHTQTDTHARTRAVCACLCCSLLVFFSGVSLHDLFKIMSLCAHTNKQTHTHTQHPPTHMHVHTLHKHCCKKQDKKVFPETENVQAPHHYSFFLKNFPPHFVFVGTRYKQSCKRCFHRRSCAGVLILTRPSLLGIFFCFYHCSWI